MILFTLDEQIVLVGNRKAQLQKSGAANPSAVGASASAGTAGGATGCASGASAPNGATSACPDHVTHGGDME